MLTALALRLPYSLTRASVVCSVETITAKAARYKLSIF